MGKFEIKTQKSLKTAYQNWDTSGGLYKNLRGLGGAGGGEGEGVLGPLLLLLFGTDPLLLSLF